MKKEEEQVLKHVPWVMWSEWIDVLSQYKYGVQLGTAAAGQFQLNCSYHGIPCIGYSNLKPSASAFWIYLRLLHYTPPYWSKDSI